MMAHALSDRSDSFSKGRLRTVSVFAAASLAAVVAGAATLAATGVPVGSWSRNPIAWLVGLVLAAGLMLFRISPPLVRVVLGVALLGIGGTFVAPAQEGVHRWIDLGPLHINAGALLLPPAVVALAFCGISSRTGLVFSAAIAAFLVLQPDASQATSFLVAVIILLTGSTAPRPRRLSAIAAALLIAAIAWSRPDPLQPVPQVEGIFPLAAGVSALLAAAAGLALAAASLAPLAIHATTRGMRRTAALALTGYFVSAAICPAFGAFPVPLVGLGMSFPLGYWLGIALLCTNEGPAQNQVSAGAISRL